MDVFPKIFRKPRAMESIFSENDWLIYTSLPWITPSRVFSKNKRSNKRRNVTKEAIKQKKIKNNKRSEQKNNKRIKNLVSSFPLKLFLWLDLRETILNLTSTFLLHITYSKVNVHKAVVKLPWQFYCYFRSKRQEMKNKYNDLQGYFERMTKEYFADWWGDSSL